MRPPLELTATLTGPGGRRWRLAPDSRPSERPLDVSFTTEAGEGFGTGQITLRRRYDGEYPDLGLLNNVVIEGYDGQIAYEGRVQGTPRALDGSGSQVRMDLAGWMSHARQRQFTELIIDRDLTQWGDLTLGVKLWAAIWGYTGPFYGPQITDGQIVCEATRIAQAATGVMMGADYVAPVPIGRVYARLLEADTGWDAHIETASEWASGIDIEWTNTRNGSGDLDFSPSKRVRLATTFIRFNGAHTGDGLWRYRFVPTVFGTHGLTPAGSGATDFTFALTDVLRYLFGRYAPKIDTSQIRDNNYPVKHAVWREPTNAHEAVKDLNAYSQWALGVYENRQLEYRPFDLSKYDWQVRAGQDGVEIETPGVTVDDAFNGVVVSFTDWAGAQQVVTPDDAAELRDTNPAIAANQWGEQAWTALSLSNPVAQTDAVGMGSLYLAELNRPKFPSTITVPGHIRDRTGAWRQNWLPRANQTVSVMNHPNDQPRLITGTSWAGGKLTITTDNALNRWEAINTRLERARSAGGM